MSNTAIANHALLSDRHSAALVDRSGSIEWLSFPRRLALSLGRLLGKMLGTAEVTISYAPRPEYGLFETPANGHGSQPGPFRAVRPQPAVEDSARRDGQVELVGGGLVGGNQPSVHLDGFGGLYSGRRRLEVLQPLAREHRTRADAGSC
jgi:hypothetical protein